MWIVHGLILDIVVIGVLPFISEKASDAQRADKFPWALGGYGGNGGPYGFEYPKVPNLAPTHRRFIAENAAYAVLRICPIFFITSSTPQVAGRSLRANAPAAAAHALSPHYRRCRRPHSAVPVLLMCVISYAIEGMTIAWELASYKAPANAMLPQTLMGVFASVVTYTATTNTDGYIPVVEPGLLLAMQIFCTLTWVFWIKGFMATAM